MMKIRLKNKKLIGKVSVLLTVAIFTVVSLSYPTQASEGDTWITPASQNVGASQDFSIEVHIDTGGKDIGVFNMYLDFDPSLVTVDTTQGTDGADKGADTTDYTVMSNVDDIANGHYRFAGMTASGHANSGDAHLVTIHMQTTSSFTSGTASLDLRINELSDELGQALTTGTITGATISYVSSDTTPPTLSSPLPSGTLLPGTTSETLSVTTSENATCRYSTSANTAYDSMSDTFSTTGTTDHSESLTGLTNGSTYNYYVRCADEAGNKNTADYTVSFSVSGQTYGNADFAQLATAWLQAGDTGTDINSDGIVNARDLGIMMSNWSN